MVFKRRDKRPFWIILRDFLWPRGGWTRAFHYVKHRLRRLPDTPHRIARGIAAGVFTVFTPFYGLHFVVAATLAWILRGNILASLLGTFVGNPLTYIPIGVICLQTGHFLLGRPPRPEGEIRDGIAIKFLHAADDLKDNFAAIFTDRQAEWHGLSIFYHEIFFPYMIGGIIPGLIAAAAAYYVSLPLIKAYQARRRGAIQAKLKAIKAKTHKVEGR